MFVNYRLLCTDKGEDEEKVYKMAAVLSDNGGLEVMLLRLASIRDLVSGKHLLAVLLKLFSYCVKVKVNRVRLIQPEMNTISVMLGALNLVSNVTTSAAHLSPTACDS